MERGSVVTALIGPNDLLREALAHVLNGADFQVRTSASHIDDSIVASLPQDRALLIIEVGSGIEATVGQIATFKERCPGGRVVVLAHQLELPEMVLAFTVGANAYLASVAARDVFIKSLELVMLGETILPPSLLDALYRNAPDGGNGKLDHYGNGKPEHERRIKADHADGGKDEDTDDDVKAARKILPKISDKRVAHLSARQTLILRYLISGDSNKTIARKIHITEATVKVHVKAILRKTRVHNRTQAAIWAMNNRSFVPSKDSPSSAMSKPSIQPFPGVTTTQVSPPGRFESGDLQDGASAGDAHLVRKDMERKCN
jgi:two-component system, NarL family, nitrate/nitrite response regulator NarL